MKVNGRIEVTGQDIGFFFARTKMVKSNDFCNMEELHGIIKGLKE